MKDENMRYYWMRLMENFFDEIWIKKLRKQPNGDTLVIIYLKMGLRSMNDNAMLSYEGIGQTFAEELSLSLEENEEEVTLLVDFLLRTGLMEKINENIYYLPEIDKCIGSETKGAVKKRIQRRNKTNFDINNEKPTLQGTTAGQSGDTQGTTAGQLEDNKGTPRGQTEDTQGTTAGQSGDTQGTTAGQSGDNRGTPRGQQGDNVPQVSPLDIRDRDIEKKRISNDILKKECDAEMLKSLDPVCVKLTENLVKACEQSLPNQKGLPKTDLQKYTWAMQLQPLLKNYSREDMEKAMNYAITNEFWKARIRSTKKFVKNFEQLLLQANEKKPKFTLKNKFNNFEGREIDYDKLESQLLGNVQ